MDSDDLDVKVPFWLALYCGTLSAGFVLFVVAAWQRTHKEGGVSDALVYTGIALVVLPVVACLSYLIHDCLIHLPPLPTLHDENEGLENFRATDLHVNPTADEGIELALQDTEAGTATEYQFQEAGTREERREYAKAFLLFRTLDRGDSVRTLSALLKATKDEESSDQGSLLFRAWKSTESSVRSIGSSPPECSICQERYEHGDIACWAITDDCDHIFHDKCILKWLENRDECPLCRTKLLAPDE